MAANRGHPRRLVCQGVQLLRHPAQILQGGRLFSFAPPNILKTTSVYTLLFLSQRFQACQLMVIIQFNEDVCSAEEDPCLAADGPLKGKKKKNCIYLYLFILHRSNVLHISRVFLLIILYNTSWIFPLRPSCTNTLHARIMVELSERSRNIYCFRNLC